MERGGGELLAISKRTPKGRNGFVKAQRGCRTSKLV